MDHSRVNEYGYSGEMLEEAEKKKLEKDGKPKALQEKKDDWIQPNPLEF